MSTKSPADCQKFWCKAGRAVLFQRNPKDDANMAPPRGKHLVESVGEAERVADSLDDPAHVDCANCPHVLNVPDNS